MGSNAPSSKLTAAGIAGAIVVILQVLAVATGVDIDLPPALITAVATLIMLGVGYVKPENRPSESAMQLIRGDRTLD